VYFFRTMGRLDHTRWCITVNICLDRNILVLMIDKRCPRIITMQKAEKKIQTIESWALGFIICIITFL